MLRNLCDTVSPGGRKSIGNWSTAVLYAGGGLTYRQATGSYSTAIAQHYQSENFYVHPLQFRNRNAVLENHSGSATMPRKKFDDFLAI